MKILKKMKDGGPNSSVTGYWLFEFKRFFSIVLLKFEGKGREAYHTHAFDSVNWVLKGQLTETMKDGQVYVYKASADPILTLREDFHKVDSQGTTWVLAFRGPWKKNWQEYLPAEDQYVTLENGRKVVKNIT